MTGERAPTTTSGWDFYTDQDAVDSYLRHRDGGGSRNSLIEEPAFLSLVGDVRGLRCLDLGCGYGHYARILARNGASVVGVDRAELMLAEARRRQDTVAAVRYVRADVATVDFRSGSFDLVVSNLTLHYLPDPESVFRRVSRWLRRGGRFVFSVEHPIVTAHRRESQWASDDSGERGFLVSHYFSETERWGYFGRKYHHTVSTWINSFLMSGFRVTAVVEPVPAAAAVAERPHLAEDMERPPFLLAAGVSTDWSR